MIKKKNSLNWVENFWKIENGQSETEYTKKNYKQKNRTEKRICRPEIKP